MDDNSDNVIPLVQHGRDEAKLLNVTVSDRKEYSQQRCKHRAIEVCAKQIVLFAAQGAGALLMHSITSCRSLPTLSISSQRLGSFTADATNCASP